MNRTENQVSEPIYWNHPKNAEQKDKDGMYERRCKKDIFQVLPANWQEV